MKKIILALFSLGLLIGAASAQNLKATTSTHQVTLTWTASGDSTTSSPGTVNVYRTSGSCPGTVSTSGLTPLTTTAPAGGPYTDTGVAAGTWCYFVTATINNATSLPSNAVQAVLLPLAPSNLAIGSQN